MGDSAGEPRRVSSPGLFAELFSAAVDYLGIQVPFVDREKIGVIGICGSGGFSLAAAAVDTRIKAVATASMYDITDVRGMMDLSKDQLDQMKDELVQQRWEDYAKAGEPQRQDATYKPLLKLRSTFPTNTRVLNIYGDKEDGSHSDGDVPVNSAKSLKYLVSGRAKSYREVEIKGANAQHSTLHNNSQVNRELINFLWRK